MERRSYEGRGGRLADLWVGARDNDLDQNLGRMDDLRDGDVMYGDGRVCMDMCFFHCAEMHITGLDPHGRCFRRGIGVEMVDRIEFETGRKSACLRKMAG